MKSRHVKHRVLLLDDRTVRRPGSNIESKLEPFAIRLREREGFVTEAPPAIDERGFSIEDKSLAEIARICRRRIDTFQADALVLDMNWWGDDEYGEKLWGEMKADGLALSEHCLIFLTMFLEPARRIAVAERNSLSPKQVGYKDTSGYNAAAKWLVDHL